MESQKNIIIVDEYEHALIAGLIVGELIDLEEYDVLNAVGTNKIERLSIKLQEFNDRLAITKEEEKQKVIDFLNKVLFNFGIY